MTYDEEYPDISTILQHVVAGWIVFTALVLVLALATTAGLAFG